MMNISSSTSYDALKHLPREQILPRNENRRPSDKGSIPLSEYVGDHSMIAKRLLPPAESLVSRDLSLPSLPFFFADHTVSADNSGNRSR
jgi:hypothetical protein